jgi:hypothetical protein
MVHGRKWKASCIYETHIAYSDRLISAGYCFSLRSVMWLDASTHSCIRTRNCKRSHVSLPIPYRVVSNTSCIDSISASVVTSTKLEVTRKVSPTAHTKNRGACQVKNRKWRRSETSLKPRRLMLLCIRSDLGMFSSPQSCHEEISTRPRPRQHWGKLPFYLSFHRVAT